MALAKAIHRFERVVPVRFARAPDPVDPTVATGTTFDRNAPEPDNRGFLPRTANGAVFPIGLDEAVAAAARSETRVRLLRVDMENGGQLFLTLENPTLVQITLPAGGAALPGAQAMMIKMRPLVAGTTRLQVRFGSIAGPIVHQMELSVNPIVDVRMVAHVPVINGAALNDSAGNPVPPQSGRSDADIRALVGVANEVFIPYGINFALDAAVDRDPAPLALRNQGAVNFGAGEDNTVAAHNRARGAINTHFVPQIIDPPDNPPDSVTGLGITSVRAPNTFALFVADAGIGQTVAHELGHVLNIVNFATGRLGHAHENGQGVAQRDDVITRRRLMHPALRPGPDALRPYRDDVGYGDIAGGMITVKQLDNDPTDLEMLEVQRAAARLIAAAAGP